MVLTTLPKLPPRQEEVLRFIARFFVKHRHMPTQREICQELQVNSTSAAPYVNPLMKKGYLNRIDETARTVGRNFELTELAVEKLKLLGEPLVVEDGQLAMNV